ncbi:coiled-coil domain-containing protein [Mesorhizobium tianshanense]|nr:hypothetical protein [Mesorhizobium tianshanense]
MKPDADLSECISDLPEESSWDWESPADLATEPASSSQVAVASDMADLDVRPQNANYLRFGVRIEYFDVISKPCESSPVAQTDAVASARNIPQSGRLATSIREIADYAYRQVAANLAALSIPVLRALSRVPRQLALAEPGKRIYGSAWNQLGHKAPPRKVARLANPARRGLKATAQSGGFSLDPDPTIATASPPRVGRPIGLVSRLGVAAICLAVPLGYAMTRQNWVEIAPAISQAQGYAHRDLSRLVELQASAALDRPAHGGRRTSVELLSPDLTASRVQLGTAGAQAVGARELAGLAHRTAEGERARSAALQRALLESHKQIDALRASMAAADKAREERLRKELEAARTLDALRRIAGDARALLREATNYVFTEMPDAHLQRQRADRLTGDLARARAQIEQLEAEAAKDRAKAKASLAQASGMLDDERQKSEDLRRDLAEMKLASAALVERADAAEQERTGAVTARERAEQTATETAQALARERAAAVSTHEELDKARLERDAARALLVQVSRLREALDKQRKATVSLARDLAAARADNDRLRAERRSAQIETPQKPRSGRAAAATGRMKAVSQKTARSKARNPSRVARVRSIPLPYSLRPRYATLE